MVENTIQKKMDFNPHLNVLEQCDLAKVKNENLLLHSTFIYSF